MNKLFRKLRSGKGFSMSELLVASLILGLMTLALANGISTSMRVYNDSVNYSEKRMLLATMADAIASELRYSKEAKISADDTHQLLSYTSANYGFNCKLTTKDNTVKVVKLTENGDETEQTYDLLGNGVYSNKQKLQVQIENEEEDKEAEETEAGKRKPPGEIHFDSKKGWYQFTVAVYNKDNANDPGERRTITVKPFEMPEIPEGNTEQTEEKTEEVSAG